MLNGIPPSPKTFEGIVRLTTHSDLAFGNLEIPLTEFKTRTSRKSAKELLKKDQWILKADPRHAPFLKASGIGAVSLANNHAMDFGVKGLTEMIRLLNKNHIAYAGAGRNADEAMSHRVISLEGRKRIALLSVLGFQTRGALYKTTPATTSSPGVGVLNLNGRLDKKVRDKLSGWIGKAHDKADFVVVAIHWGVERKPLPTPYQVSLGRALVDAGADVVWGNHPHVLQGAEIYKGKLIMYSMGNLISSLPCHNGFFKLSVDEEGQEVPEFIPGDVRGGRVSLLGVSQRTQAKKAMRALCRLLLKRYPSPVSTPAL